MNANAVGLMLGLLILRPLLVIWAVNLLFGMTIEQFDFYTWFAALILCSLVGSRTSKVLKNG